MTGKIPSAVPMGGTEGPPSRLGRFIGGRPHSQPDRSYLASYEEHLRLGKSWRMAAPPTQGDPESEAR